MEQRPTLEAIIEAVNQVEHPEIAATLQELGMLRNFDYDPEENTFSFTLVVPFLGIPQTVRDYMIHAVARAAHELGVKNFRVTVEPMNAAERMRFVDLEHSKWKAGGTPGQPQM